MQQRRVYRTIFVGVVKITILVTTVFVWSAATQYCYAQVPRDVLLKQAGVFDGDEQRGGRTIERTAIVPSEDHRKACQDGKAVRCYEYALDLMTRNSAAATADDMKSAMLHLDKACRSGYSSACLEYLRARLRSQAQTLVALHDDYRENCQEGRDDQCVQLALLYLHHGDQVRSALQSAPASSKKDLDISEQGLGRAAAQYLRRACQKDMAPACTELGILVLTVGQNAQSAEDFIRKGCYLGDARACVTDPTRLALKSEPQVMRDLFMRGCQLDEAIGCFYLASSLEVLPIRAEREAAIEHFAKACHLGIPKACVRVATLYIKHGELDAAARSLDRPCGYGDGESCFTLAGVTRLQMGDARPHYRRSLEIFKQDCHLGDAKACVRMKEAEALSKLGILSGFLASLKFKLAMFFSRL
jgi:TPR repeat protein